MTDLIADPILSGVPVREGYKVLGGVVIYRKLGQGGMGAVYRGRHLRLDIDVAVKVTAPPVGVSPARTETFARRFVREARTAAAVKHPNLIRVYDVDSESGVQFLIMDYVDGESAADRLERKGKLGEEEAVRIVLGAADGLAAAHGRGIIHRDAKPDNILIDDAGDIVLVDLGLAKACGPADGDAAPAMDLSASTEAIGTPNYMSPEQTRASKDVGPPSDVWSLGVSLYELVTGWLPFRDADVNDLIYRIRREPLPDVRALYPGLSGGICDVIERALEKDPRERYADCGELASAFREHLALAAPEGGSLAGPRADGAPPRPAASPPPGRVLERIAESVSGARPGSERAEEDLTRPLPSGEGLRRTSTDLIESRVKVEDARADLGEPRLEGESGLFRIVDRDLRIARELEREDARGAVERYVRLQRALAALDERRRALEGVDWGLLERFFLDLHESARARIREADSGFRSGESPPDGAAYARIAGSLGEAELLAETRRQGRRFSTATAAGMGTLGAVVGGIMPVASSFADAVPWAVVLGGAAGTAGAVAVVLVTLLTATGERRRFSFPQGLLVLAGGAAGALAGLVLAAGASWMHVLLGRADQTVAVARAAAALGVALGAVGGLVAPNRADRSLIAKAVAAAALGGLFMALLAAWVPTVSQQSWAVRPGSGSVFGALWGLICGAGLGVVAGTINASSEKGAVARRALTRRTSGT